jgi:hypothetical protein
MSEWSEAGPVPLPAARSDLRRSPEVRTWRQTVIEQIEPLFRWQAEHPDDRAVSEAEIGDG